MVVVDTRVVIPFISWWKGDDWQAFIAGIHSRIRIACAQGDDDAFDRPGPTVPPIL